METKPECYQGFYSCLIHCVWENLYIDFAPFILCWQVAVLLIVKLGQELRFSRVIECWRRVYQSLLQDDGTRSSPHSFSTNAMNDI
jgi:hypothetical protein